jgi:hypothetical protein
MPLVVFGNDDGTRLQIGEISQRLFASVSTSGASDAGAEFSLKQAALVVVAGEGDGFLKNVLPKEPLIFGFDITIGFSTAPSDRRPDRLRPAGPLEARLGSQSGSASRFR